MRLVLKYITNSFNLEIFQHTVPFNKNILYVIFSLGLKLIGGNLSKCAK